MIRNVRKSWGLVCARPLPVPVGWLERQKKTRKVAHKHYLYLLSLARAAGAPEPGSRCGLDTSSSVTPRARKSPCCTACRPHLRFHRRASSSSSPEGTASGAYTPCRHVSAGSCWRGTHRRGPGWSCRAVSQPSPRDTAADSDGTAPRRFRRV